MNRDDTTKTGGASPLRPAGTLVGRYRLADRLDEGGTGLVYRAVDTRIGRTVALKFLHPDLTRDARARGRFIHDARGASALGHPNICAVFQIDETPDGETYLAMAYYEGEMLGKRLERGPLKLADALDIGAQIAQGLSRTHARGIIHGGIKPASIFITQDGLVKILDFGLARLAGEAKAAKAGAAPSAARYLPPEQVRGEEADERSDIWSLGVVLYEMVAGRSPFAAPRAAAAPPAPAGEEPEKLAAVRGDMPAELERIVGKAMAGDPAERYQHVEDLMVDLKRLAKRVAIRATGRRVLAAARHPEAARPRTNARRALLIAIPLLLIAAAIIITAALLLRRDRERADSSAPPRTEESAPTQGP